MNNMESILKELEDLQLKYDHARSNTCDGKFNVMEWQNIANHYRKLIEELLKTKV